MCSQYESIFTPKISQVTVVPLLLLSMDPARVIIQWLLRMLRTLYLDFKSYHFALMDLTEDSQTLGEEQALLDAYDDKVIEQTT